MKDVQANPSFQKAYAGRNIVTEIAKAGPFFKAEDYHQQYLDNNPGGKYLFEIFEFEMFEFSNSYLINQFEIAISFFTFEIYLFIYLLGGILNHALYLFVLIGYCSHRKYWS